MEKTAKSRFYEIMDLLGLTDYRVYTDIKDITKNMMVKLRNGETEEVSIKILIPFCIAFEKVNPDYILTGRGTPLRETENIPLITDTPKSDKDIKILDIRVCAGHGIGLDGDENKITGYVNIPDFSGCYGVIVYGDSMYDMYMPGDTIFVRRVNDWRSIDNGQPYVIITNEDRLLKMIHIDYKNKKTVLSSYNNVCNPDGRRKYPDMEIDMDNDVKFLYKVVGKLARTQM